MKLRTCYDFCIRILHIACTFIIIIYVLYMSNFDLLKIVHNIVIQSSMVFPIVVIGLGN